MRQIKHIRKNSDLPTKHHTPRDHLVTEREAGQFRLGMSHYLNNNIAVLPDQARYFAEQAKAINTDLFAISRILEETNLLALSAIIEVAKSEEAEAGREFTEAAEEIRALANHTQKSTQQIAEMIRPIQDSLKRTADSLEFSANRAEQALQNALANGKTLKEISVAIEQTAVEKPLVEIALHSQVERKHEDSPVINIENIALKITSDDERKITIGQSLSKIADHLNSIVSKYKI